MNSLKPNDRMIGESASFLHMQEHVSRLAPLHKPALIIGERGTGKELIASRLHYLSTRWQQPFLKINCAAFSKDLLESQLFGHEAGAFTGANKQHKGYFERAHKGTLFLDELASASLAVQEKILRVTEYGEIERLGGSATFTVDVRIVAATNIDLPHLASQGKFREDLLDRLAFAVVTLPPLRKRIEDITILAQQFAMDMVQELGREYFPGFSKSASKQLEEYPWPGNIRELKNVVERCVYQSEDPDAIIKDLVFDPFASPYRPTNKQQMLITNQPDSQIDSTTTDFKQKVQNYEKKLIIEALQQSQFNQRKAAKLLALSYDQLRGYVRKYQLNDSITQEH